MLVGDLSDLIDSDPNLCSGHLNAEDMGCVPPTALPFTQPFSHEFLIVQ